MKKEAITNLNLQSLLKERWSPRSFSSKVPSSENLATILEAARWAPSCNNEQPWRILLGIKGENSHYDKILETLAEGNQVWAKTAPVLIILYTKKTFTRNGKPNNWAEYDAGQAAAHMSVQAMDLNIYVHQMAGFDRDLAAGLINTDEDLLPVTAMALGYIGDADQLPEDIKKRELAPRSRKKLTDIIIGGFETKGKL